MSDVFVAKKVNVILAKPMLCNVAFAVSAVAFLMLAPWRASIGEVFWAAVALMTGAMILACLFAIYDTARRLAGPRDVIVIDRTGIRHAWDAKLNVEWSQIRSASDFGRPCDEVWIALADGNHCLSSYGTNKKPDAIKAAIRRLSPDPAKITFV